MNARKVANETAGTVTNFTISSGALTSPGTTNIGASANDVLVAP